MSQKIIIDVRFSYVHVFTPSAIGDGAVEKYSASLIIPKTDTVNVEKIKKAIEVAKQEFAAANGGKVPANLKTPLRDGDLDCPDDPAYAGCYFLNANSTSRPGVVDANVQKIIDPEDFYSGCYGRASITIHHYNSAGNKGIRAELNNVQKVRDGERLGGKASAEDDFAEFGTGLLD